MADEITSDVQASDVASPPPAPTPDDSFEADLREFGEATARGNVPSPDRQAPAPDRQQRAQQAQEQIDAVRELGQLREWAVGVEGERVERREREESEAVFAEGRETIADFNELSADFAERWLRAEYSIDPELHAAWNSRHDSADAMRWCQGCVRRAMGRLREAAKRVPDTEATATKTAVAASIAALTRGGRPPAPTPPNYSNMTDKEFREAVKKEHGYTPL